MLELFSHSTIREIITLFIQHVLRKLRSLPAFSSSFTFLLNIEKKMTSPQMGI